ncbi:hypothetical protein Taro_041625 [Colocasia esculenta]|uniref:Uncharacterized protein n=1 Tax=Colocasia esculenta TaxID=4460 RepID=A0A843WQF5_COLES|nr:hypothetical protein [Colocasia esculenta]
MSQIKVQVQKERCSPLGAYPEDMQKGHSQLTVQGALTLTTHTAGNAWQTSHHYDRPTTNSYDSESLPEESRGSTTKQWKQSKRLDHNPGQAKDDSRRTSGQHNAEASPRHTPAETKKLKEHRSDHVRPESHNTSTNISDLHEVGKEQPGVTTRDSEQPCEKQRLTTGTTTSDLHKVEGSQAEPTCTSDTPRGQGTTPTGATTNGTKERVTETAVGCLHKAP